MSGAAGGGGRAAARSAIRLTPARVPPAASATTARVEVRPVEAAEKGAARGGHGEGASGFMLDGLTYVSVSNIGKRNLRAMVANEARKGHISGMAKKDGYHHGDLRAGLVEAARALVEANGPERLSLSDACRAAGVSTAAPYRHFPDKDALLFAVAQGGMDRQAAAMREAASHHSLGSVEAITAIGRAYVDFALREPGLFKLMFSLTRGHQNEAELVQKGEATFGIVLTQIAARTGLAARPSGGRADGLPALDLRARAVVPPDRRQALQARSRPARGHRRDDRGLGAAVPRSLTPDPGRTLRWINADRVWIAYGNRMARSVR